MNPAPRMLYKIIQGCPRISLTNLSGFFLALIFLLSFPLEKARAQQRPLGIGLILGSPTGINLKYWKSRENAFDAGAAWSLNEDDSFQLYGDYLWHRYDFTGEERTPVYYGLGVRVGLGGSHSGIGVRFPAGLTHLLGQYPIDLFIELAPVLHLAPDTGLGLEGGIGVRFYIKQ